MVIVIIFTCHVYLPLDRGCPKKMVGHVKHDMESLGFPGRIHRLSASEEGK